jgi:hypothetical protein
MAASMAVELGLGVVVLVVVVGLDGSAILFVVEGVLYE